MDDQTGDASRGETRAAVRLERDHRTRKSLRDRSTNLERQHTRSTIRHAAVARSLLLSLLLGACCALTASAEPPQPAAKVAAASPQAKSPSATAVAAEISGAPEERVAAPQVEKLHGTLIEIMRSAKELGYQGRYDRLSPTVLETFDLKFMASKSVGRHWRKLDAADQERWLETFVQVITANYAGRFSGYTGESFETLGEEPAIHDTHVVRTQLLRPGEDSVQLNYRLRDVDGEWRIIDIYLNGTVSELALRRSEYSSVLKREGFEKLISTLNDKVESLSQG